MPRILTAFLFVLLAITPAMAKGEDSYKQAMEAYKAKDYQKTVKLLNKAIGEGFKKPGAYLYLAAAYHGAGHKEHATNLYKKIIQSYPKTAYSKQATTALQSLDPTFVPPHESASSSPNPSDTTNAVSKAPSAQKPSAELSGVLSRMSVTPPRFGHKPVSQDSINAVKNAIINLPAHLRQKLDDYGASICIAPNLIDKWPDSVDTLPENSPELNLAEQPGRIYNKEMTLYERSKLRNSTSLSRPRTTKEMAHTVLNQSVQLLDGIMTISKDKEFRKLYNLEKAKIPDGLRVKLATFMKNDEWGPRETCAEMGAAMLGGGDEYTRDLYICFPQTKAWLKRKLAI